MKTKKVFCFVLVLALALGLSGATVSAAEFIKADANGSVNVDSEQVVKNLYTAGGMATIDSNIESDLHVAGGTVMINGNVENDLYVGGGNIIIKGDIGGSVHAVGGSIIIDGKVGRNLNAGGGSIIVSKTSSIGGDIVAGAGSLDIRGPVSGDIKAGGGQMTINNTVGGNVNVQIQNSLTLGENAKIDGNLTYKSPNEAKINAGAKIVGKVDFVKTAGKVSTSKGVFVGAFLAILSAVFLIKLLICLVSALVIFYLFKKTAVTIVKESMDNVWANLGIGFAGIILTPIAVVLLLVTIAGAYLAGILGALYALTLLTSSVLASIIFGSVLVRWYKKQHEYHVSWKTIVVGVITLNIIKIIPVLGWLVAAAFMLVTIGVIYKMIYKLIGANR